MVKKAADGITGVWRTGATTAINYSSAATCQENRTSASLFQKKLPAGKDHSFPGIAQSGHAIFACFCNILHDRPSISPAAVRISIPSPRRWNGEDARIPDPDRINCQSSLTPGATCLIFVPHLWPLPGPHFCPMFRPEAAQTFSTVS